MRRAAILFAFLAAALPLSMPVVAQIDDSPAELPIPVPPPLPPEEPPDDAEEYRPQVPVVDPHADVPWGLEEQLEGALQTKADVYGAFARRFTCDETARASEYDGSGRPGDEVVRQYAYLLVNDPATGSLRESRRQFTRDGERVRGGEVDDREPFPPAYAWVFMFSRMHESFFDFRHVDRRFEGFDLVLEIQFRGSMPFTDGRDIRQWEGTVLVDAFNYRPLEILAEPRGQSERLEQLYRAWASSMNIMGFRTKKPPLGYRARIDFGYFREDLSFPTALRYDTFRAVSPTQVVPIRASMRTYRNYLFYEVEEGEELGDVVGERRPN
jgi:hypothetical protein